MKRWLLGAAIAAAWLVVQPARAEPPPTGDVEEARRHYARGVELYNQGADAAALAELERAYQLAPNWKVLYELGVVELALHDFAAALRHFQQYLDEGKDAVKGARKKEVVDDVARLQQQVATIEVVAAPGVQIKLDDAEVATAPLAKPLVVNPGHHRVGASKDGLVAETRTVSVAEGDHTRVELVLPEPAPPPQPAPPPPPVAVPEPAPPAPLLVLPSPPPREEPAPRPRGLLWAGGIATGALAVGAVVTGLEALSANDSLTHAKNDGPSSQGTLSSLSSKARGFALASDVMTGAAVVAGGVTLYLVLRTPAPRAASAGVGLSLQLGLGRASVEGRF